MAWTTPRTWTDGELVTKAIMDVHVRDNLLAAYPHLIVRKTADETVVSSTVLQNDDSLILPVAANEIYKFEFNIVYSSATNANIKMAFTFPAAGRIDASAMWVNDAVAATLMSWSGTTTPTTSVIMDGGGTTVRYSLPLQGIFTNAGTAGSLTLQWAQDTSQVSNTTVHANSTLWAVKLA